MARTFVGAPAVEAVLPFTARAARPLTRREAELGLRQGGGPQALASLLDATGWVARPVRIQEGFLHRLEGPGLAEARDGGWLMLRPVGPDRIEVRGAGGTVDTCTPGELTPGLGTWAVTARPAPPTGATLYGRMLHGVLRRKGLLRQILQTSLLLQGVVLLIPQATRIALDQALTSGARSLLATVALGLVVLALFQSLTGWLRQRAVLHLETFVEAELGRDFLSHVLGLPYAVLSRHKLGELLQAHEGLDAARDLFTTSVLGNLLDGLLSCFTLAAMAATMPGPTGVVLALSLLLVGLVVGIGRIQEALVKRRIAAQVAEQGYLVELLKGIATVKAAGSEVRGFARWCALLGEHLSLNLRQQRIGLWHEVGLESIRQATAVVILIWGGRLVLAGELQVGALMAFVLLSGTFLAGMLGLAQAYLSWRAVRPQLARAASLLEEGAEPPMLPGSVAPIDGAVHVEDLWFRYGPELPWVLQGYDLRVAPGEKRWIHAPSGFGKTTLLRVLAGLCTPERGAVRLGGHAPATVRGQVLYLPQTTQLYGGSILENLRMLSGGAAQERLMEAAHTSGLDRWVEGLPMGYHTVIAAGGGNLSGGQRQLVALTAAMASDATVLLLDEAMANLDWVTKGWLHDSPWFKGKTVIYASHDAGMG